MAPEFPPRLVVFTLEHQDDVVVAAIENVEPTVTEERLRVRWSEVKCPPGYREVGSGALFVQENDHIVFDGPRPIILDELEDGRFRWVQGTQPQAPWVMIAVVLPEGCTMKSPQPAPTSAKNLNGRLAAYWCLRGDDLGRAHVSWDLEPFVGEVRDEVRSLNSHSILESVPPAAGIDMLAPDTQGSQEPLTVFLCHGSEDKPFVRDLYGRLQSNGFTPWLDERDILPGQAWENAIHSAVRETDVVLVCLSRTSVSRTGYLQREITRVLEVAEEQPEGAIFVIPVRIDDAPVPERLSKWQWLDFHADGAYDLLMRALEKRQSQIRLE